MQIFVRFECFNVFFFHRRDFKILPYWQFYLFEWVRNIAKLKNTRSVADPGFPWGGGTNPPGDKHTILLNFPKNCMKSKEFGPRGRLHPKFYYVDPLLAIYGVVFLHLLNRHIILNITFCLPLVLKENENCKYFKDALYFILFYFIGENSPIAKILFFFLIVAKLKSNESPPVKVWWKTVVIVTTTPMTTGTFP